jgi:hypothetical protein
VTLRFDNGIIQTLNRPFKAHQGHLRLDGIATRVGVFEYRDRSSGKIIRELRHPDDVLDPKSLETLAGVPMTVKHPPVRVTPTNFDSYGVGIVGDEIDATSNPYIKVKINLQKADAIAKVASGMRELSCGYDCDVIDESGVFTSDSGEQLPYDKRQTNIRYNHLAIVDFARAGRDARVRFDSEEDFAEQQEIVKPLPLDITSPEPHINRGNIFNLTDLAHLLFA